MVRIKNREQIIRIDGKSVFVEFLDNAFGIEKVQINFLKYDEKTNKKVSGITFYIDFADFLVLEHDVLSGRIGKLAQIERQKEQKGFPNPVYMKLGGVSAANLAKRGQSRPDGASLSRVLKIVPGNKLLFQAEQGKGEDLEKGLIKPVFGTKPDIRIMVPMTDENLKAVVLSTGARIRAYQSAAYVYHNKDHYNLQVVEEKRKREQRNK